MKLSHTILSGCLVMLAIHGPLLQAAATPTATRAPLTLKAAEQNAQRMLRTLVEREAAFLNGRGTKASFTKMAKDMVDVAEKFEQAADLVNGYDGRSARVLRFFEKHIVDQSVVQKRLHGAFAELQTLLVKDTVALCVQHGVPIGTIHREVKIWPLKPAAFADSYRLLIQRGAKITQSDWFRTGAGLVAAHVASGVAESAAREMGLWNHKEGSWMDMLLGVAVEAAATAVIDEVSDPTPDIAKSLKSGFEQLTDVHIRGKNGFGDTCRQVMQYHLDVRKKLVGGLKGGAK